MNPEWKGGNTNDGFEGSPTALFLGLAASIAITGFCGSAEARIHRIPGGLSIITPNADFGQDVERYCQHQLDRYHDNPNPATRRRYQRCMLMWFQPNEDDDD